MIQDAYLLLLASSEFSCLAFLLESPKHLCALSFMPVPALHHTGEGLRRGKSDGISKKYFCPLSAHCRINSHLCLVVGKPTPYSSF